MDDLERVKQRLAEIPISQLRVVGKRSGVPFGTIFKIKYGTTKNPGFYTVKALTKYFRARRARAAA